MTVEYYLLIEIATLYKCLQIILCTFIRNNIHMDNYTDNYMECNCNNNYYNYNMLIVYKLLLDRVH